MTKGISTTKDISTIKDISMTKCISTIKGISITLVVIIRLMVAAMDMPSRGMIVGARICIWTSQTHFASYRCFQNTLLFVHAQLLPELGKPVHTAFHC